MSDDCDVFIFGAGTVTKNMPVKLSGNRNNPALNLEDKKDAHHVTLRRRNSERQYINCFDQGWSRSLCTFVRRRLSQGLWLELNARCCI
ncbi:hypothetical protein K443DRAFT_473532 [Laccaria amethystina LaAM-08-1]|uniref:Unplaced genomic scaffold K443scaffold_44, whole genome shotgun sequence n=1 Tax=Laccaria amethystina LaAM-08-1 TaxID=1095629 RepID=A0A0C9XPR5_9AGAR|nr:hypothetical protein K443DRAFT_473532 [Laccaria amethystina LaAM-08-1]